MRDYSIEATIKDYEERLETVQRELVRVKFILEHRRDSAADEETRVGLMAAIDDLTAQIGEVDDIVACLREDRADEKGAQGE